MPHAAKTAKSNFTPNAQTIQMRGSSRIASPHASAQLKAYQQMADKSGQVAQLKTMQKMADNFSGGIIQMMPGRHRRGRRRRGPEPEATVTEAEETMPELAPITGGDTEAPAPLPTHRDRAGRLRAGAGAGRGVSLEQFAAHGASLIRPEVSTGFLRGQLNMLNRSHRVRARETAWTNNTHRYAHNVQNDVRDDIRVEVDRRERGPRAGNHLSGGMIRPIATTFPMARRTPRR